MLELSSVLFGFWVCWPCVVLVGVCFSCLVSWWVALCFLCCPLPSSSGGCCLLCLLFGLWWLLVCFAAAGSCVTRLSRPAGTCVVTHFPPPWGGVVSLVSLLCCVVFVLLWCVCSGVFWDVVGVCVLGWCAWELVFGCECPALYWSFTLPGRVWFIVGCASVAPHCTAYPAMNCAVGGRREPFFHYDFACTNKGGYLSYNQAIRGCVYDMYMAHVPGCCCTMCHGHVCSCCMRSVRVHDASVVCARCAARRMCNAGGVSMNG